MDGRDRTGIRAALSGLSTPGDGEAWTNRLLRPRSAKALLDAFSGQTGWALRPDDEGELALPDADWHECELVLR